MTSAKNGSANSPGSSLESASTTAPTLRVASACADGLGTKSSSRTARWTASRLARLTCGALLITREAAVRDTPARAATSSRVGMRLGDGSMEELLLGLTRTADGEQRP